MKDYDIALRPDNPDDDPMDRRTCLDDIVVRNVEMFRAEDMGDWWWVCCYLKGEERITWGVTARRKCHLDWQTNEYPNGEYTYEHDIDKDARRQVDLDWYEAELSAGTHIPR